jgi:hypothetical protein
VYQEVAARLDGTWFLSPGSADRIPGVAPRASELTIQLSSLEADLLEAGPGQLLGTACVTFCGEVQEVDVVDVSADHIAMFGNETETSGILTVSFPLGVAWAGTAYQCVLQPRADMKPSVRWYLRWQPVQCETVEQPDSPQALPRFRILARPLLTLMPQEVDAAWDEGAWMSARNVLYQRRE